MKKKRALITGITGFTGLYLAKELNQDYDVFGLGSSEASIIQYYQVCLGNIAQLKKVIEEVKPHVIVHLAAVAFVGHESSNDFYLSNLIGTSNLLQACYAVHPEIETILLASSANVYGNQVEGILSERSPTNPANDYAVSKLSMEMMAKLWFDKLPIIITRPFNYTGVGQSANFLIPKIVDHFRMKSRTIELGNIDVWRDFNDVRNVVSAYSLLLKNKPHGEIFNICSGNLLSVREIISLAEKITGHYIEVKINQTFVRSNEVIKLCGDGNKLRSIVNSQYEYIEFEDTLTWMLGFEKYD